MIRNRSAVGVGRFLSLRVDPELLGNTGFGNPLSRWRIAATALEFAPASALMAQIGAWTATCFKRSIAAALRWPEKLWFWLGTAALVVALAVLSLALPPIASPDDAGDSSLPKDGSVLPEDRPEAGGNFLFSQANIRFCRFQQVRLEAIGPLTRRADLAVFQALANDWNARCSRYNYVSPDKHEVDAEVIERRAALESEGRALLGAWRRKIHVGVAAPAGSNISSPSHHSWDDPVGSRALPPLITLGIPEKPEAEPVSWPLLKAPSLALLQQTVAARVQRRLNDLGYVISPTDGTWAASSRTALRHFKEANGLLWDDVLDAETVTRLFSTSAVSASPAGRTRAEDGAFQTAYPPPVGARMNPLNREDAERIQRRLADLGYYAGGGDGAWGAASRSALRTFRAANALADDDEWDAATEQALHAGQAVHAADKAALQRQKGKLGGIETKLEPASARTAPVPLPPKRPSQAFASSAKSGGVAPAAVADAPRPPAPIPARALLAAHEP